MNPFFSEHQITTFTYDAVRENDLVQKCVARDDAAWSQLVRDYQPRLEVYLERVLRIRGSLINEISASIWSVLWCHRERLQAFNPATGPLFCYLGRVAIHEIDRYCQSERARAEHERRVRKKVATQDTEPAFRVGLEDVLSSLPPRAREVTEAAVLASEAGRLTHPPSARCLRHVRERLHQRCREYLSG
jgi:DNA-directed RNA polymerase specialized sigma24 family protein